MKTKNRVTAVNVRLDGVDGMIYLLRKVRPEGNFRFEGDGEREVILAVPEEAMETLNRFLAYLKEAGYKVELQDDPDELDEQGRQLRD